ncbi:MAG: ClpXP protease specificity-enhancing factor [Parasutterella sp.]
MANLPSMTPYLIRAFYEWSVDNDFTPQLSVLAEPEDYRVIVPSNYVTNNEIVLNISPTACDSLQLGNDVITFKARFAGKVESISIPVDRVKAIFIREEGYGMRFDVEPMKSRR